MWYDTAVLNFPILINLRVAIDTSDLKFMIRNWKSLACYPLVLCAEDLIPIAVTEQIQFNRGTPFESYVSTPALLNTRPCLHQTDTGCLFHLPKLLSHTDPKTAILKSYANFTGSDQMLCVSWSEVRTCDLNFEHLVRILKGVVDLTSLISSGPVFKIIPWAAFSVNHIKTATSYKCVRTAFLTFGRLNNLHQILLNENFSSTSHRNRHPERQV
jgi:hypothetical protein